MVACFCSISLFSRSASKASWSSCGKEEKDMGGLQALPEESLPNTPMCLPASQRSWPPRSVMVQGPAAGALLSAGEKDDSCRSRSSQTVRRSCSSGSQSCKAEGGFCHRGLRGASPLCPPPTSSLTALEELQESCPLTPCRCFPWRPQAGAQQRIPCWGAGPT